MRREPAWQLSPQESTVAWDESQALVMATASPAATAGSSQPSSNRWAVLALLGVAQLMVVLDATIVNDRAALGAAGAAASRPTVGSGSSRHTRSRSAACCCSAASSATCSAASGRSSPGWSASRSASAIGGLAQSFGMLVAARALQGAFGALLAPSALVAFDGDVRRHRRTARRRSGSSARSPAAAPRSVCCSAAC